MKLSVSATMSLVVVVVVVLLFGVFGVVGVVGCWLLVVDCGLSITACRFGWFGWFGFVWFRLVGWLLFRTHVNGAERPWQRGATS